MSAEPAGTVADLPDPRDPVALARALIRCPSVTPADAGALDLLAGVLDSLGFCCQRLVFEEGGAPVANLYARLGEAGPNFCFAGHTDVVPAGDAAAWTRDPFAGELAEERLWGRGAADMKGAIAAFVAAVAGLLQDNGGAPLPFSISLLITGDEEGPAVDGTRKVLEWLAAREERLDACLVGEPTNPETLGEMIKIGRRGSLNGTLRVTGRQGHVAYPHRADNPVPRLLRLLRPLAEAHLDDGTEHFEPSNLEITSVDVGNPTSNLIPASAEARFNIRFNDAHSGAALEQWLRATLDAVGEPYSLETRISGESFLTPPAGFVQDLIAAVEGETGETPVLSTGGGTSDARFIARYAPAVEFGLVGRTMHQTDENVAIADIERLSAIYGAVLRRFRQSPERLKA